jgi:hypothetical protein
MKRRDSSRHAPSGPELIKAIECVSSVEQQLTSDPLSLRNPPSLSDVRHSRTLLEDAFTIQMFIAFETLLKRFLKRHQVKIPWKVKDLIDRVSTKLKIAPEVTAAVHDVREYRNLIVHRGGRSGNQFNIAKVRSPLCKFLSWLEL